MIEKFHDSKHGAMTRIVLAPCSPFSVTLDAMRESARLARAYGVQLHTHLSETVDELQFCLERFGKRPVELMEDLGWLGSDVWFAHAVHVNADEIGLFASCGCGTAHCPSSNMRLGSGIMPLRAMLAAGVKVGLGVDGSASNDSSNLLLEARQAMLLSRLEGAEEQRRDLAQKSRSQLSARTALEVATTGGASVLGRSDIGSLEVGKCADFTAVNLNRLGFSGNHDPVAAVVFCATPRVDYTVVHGRVIVRDGRLVTLEERDLVATHSRHAKKLLEG